MTDGLSGIVVAWISKGLFSEEFTAEGWAHYRTGLMVMTDDCGLVMYPNIKMIRTLTRLVDAGTPN